MVPRVTQGISLEETCFLPLRKQCHARGQDRGTIRRTGQTGTSNCFSSRYGEHFLRSLKNFIKTNFNSYIFQHMDMLQSTCSFCYYWKFYNVLNFQLLQINTLEHISDCFKATHSQKWN